MPTKTFDLVILGGGIAGLTAAIFAARANLKTVVVEEKACGGLANWTHRVENFPSHISIHGMELMERVLDQVIHLGVTVDQAAEVQRMELIGPVKSVETGECLYTGKALILATGRHPIELDIAADCERIHYCSVCDGSAYAGKKVLVVGGGNSGFDESLYLLSLGVTEITLVEALETCCAAESTQEKLRKHPRVDIRTGTTVSAASREGDRCLVTLRETSSGRKEDLLVDGIFVFIGQQANTEMFQGVIDLDADEYILTGPDRETNVAGVFAAGDVVHKKYRYLTTAMADGTVAALAAERYIRENSPCPGSA